MIKNLTIVILILTQIPDLTAQNSDSLKVDSYLKQSETFLNGNEFEKSREFALKALEINPNCGKAYILIGSAYINSADLCSDDYLSKSMIFCLALDKFEKAKEKDKSVSERAELLIKVYAEYLPDPEIVFIEIEEGTKYQVECWINEETTLKLLKN